jgi:ankyrin repeat protein
MRLINANTFEIEEFPEYCVPHYAILSHTWGKDFEELSFRDLEEGNIEKPGIGAIKLRGCCQQAIKDGLGYAWIDTCCIDKTNLVELSEAINSMFRWYQNATICYAFLSDVPGNENPQEEGSKFQKSRWFQRGWTLQELVAPKILRFYGTITTSGTYSAQAAVDNGIAIRDWRLLGTKGNMSTTIASITGIPREYLLGIAQLHTASVAQRMSWAAHRETKRKEDLAYCLLGIFDITMPMIYGEGGDQAFFRLQEQIMKVVKDDSILAWGITKTQSASKIQFANKTGRAIAGRVMAKAPLDFANSGHIIRREQSLQHTRSVDISGGSVRAHLPLHITPTGQMFGLLSCGPENSPQQVVGIPLIKISAGLADEYIRPRGCGLSLHSNALPAITPKQILIKHDGHEMTSIDSNVLYFHYEDKDFSDINLKMINVVPRPCWDEERSLIISTSSNDNLLHEIFIRLRNNKQVSEDFILVLRYRKCNSETLAECLVFICNRNISSDDVNFPLMMKRISGQKRVNNELVSLRIALERVKQQPIFVIRPKLVLGEMATAINTPVEMKENTYIRESLRLLDENEVAEKANNELKSHIHLYDDNLEELKKEQQDISAQIKALEERQKVLMEAEKEHARKQLIVTSMRVEIQARLKSTSNQWDAIQSQWNKHQFVDDPIISLRGKTALRWAAAKGLIEVVRQRLGKGIDLNTADEDGYTPLLAASEYGNVEVARLLIDNGAALEIKAEDGVTPLFLASATGCLELVQLLLDRGADIETKDSEGITPLIAASYVGHVDTVQLLLDYGAQVEATTTENVTAMEMASMQGRDDVVHLLLSRGTVDTGLDDEKVSSDFALMEAFDPLWREHFGQYFNDEGLTDDFVQQNQEYVVEALKEKQAKKSKDAALLRSLAQLLTPPPSP